MKKWILCSLLSCLPYLLVWSQTTQEEFTYITKGYKRQISEGLDASKKGYEFEQIEKLEYEEEGKPVVFTFTKMNHEKEGLKAVIMTFEKNEKMHTFCIPHPDTKDVVWLPAIQQFNNFWLDRQRFPYFSSAFMKMMHLHEFKKMEKKEE